MNAKPLLPLLLSLLLGIPALAQGPVEVPAFAAPDFDDSSWQTTILPPADGTRPWPDGFNGVVWYRCTFELGNDMPTCFDEGSITLGESDEGLRVFVNGQLARAHRSARGIWYHRPRPLIFRHGTNHIAIEAPIENGEGGIPDQPPDHVRLWIAQAMHIVYADNHPCDSRVTDQWLFPLSGPWKYILIPSP